MVSLRLLRHRSAIRALTALALAALALTCGTAAAAGSGRVASGAVLVKFQPGVNGRAIVKAAGQEVNGETKTHALLVRLLHGESASTVVASYKSRPDVVYAELNGTFHAALSDPNDPSYSTQWALAKIRAFEGWSLLANSYNSMTGATVAVVDSGVDSSHPDLSDGRVLTSSGAVCLSGTCVADPALDDYGHGTHVAGIAAASADNGTGIAGLSFGSQIVPVKVLDSAGSGSAASLASGLIWAADHGARVINASVSSSAYSQTVCDAVAYAANAGALVVAAAGNDGTFTNEYPAACPGASGVAATDANDAVPSWSDYGYPDVFVAAPGISVLSTLPGGAYGSQSGTSMAAPYVSGLAALLFAQDPGRSAADVKALIASSAAKVGATAYSGDRFNVCGGTCTWSGTYGYGRIDVARALGGPAAPDFSLSGSPASAIVYKGGAASYTVSTAATGGFSGSVALAVSGLPAYATASFSSSPVAVGDSSTLTVATTTSTPAGTYTLTISGTSGMTHATSVALVVNAPDFSLAVAPASACTARAGKAVYTVRTASLGGFTGYAKLSVTGVPTNAKAAFSTTSLAPGGTATLTVTTASTTPLATYTMTVAALSGTIKHTAAATLDVRVPDFSVSASPASVTAQKGGKAVYTVSTSSLDGCSGTALLSVTGLPLYAKAAFSVTSVAIGGSATLTITNSTTTPDGTFTPTITASGGGTTRTTQATLVVLPPDFKLTATPASASLTAGTSAIFTVAMTPISAFAGTVTVSASGLPSGATAVFSKTSLSSRSLSGTLTLQTSSGTPAGTYTVTVTGVSGSFVHTVDISLTVA